MTPDEKQAYLRRVLPEIAKACGFKTVDVHEDGSVTVSQDGCYFYTFNPATDDRDSALVRRKLGIDVNWFDEKVVCKFTVFTKGDIELICKRVTEPHDGTPEGKGAAERWAVLRAAAKKKGLE